MITVWGRATSVNVQAVMWTLAELGLAYERIDVGGAFGGNDTPEFLAMNPNGLVPVLRDGRRTAPVGKCRDHPLSRRQLRQRAVLAGRTRASARRSTNGPSGSGRLSARPFWAAYSGRSSSCRRDKRDPSVIAVSEQRLKALAPMLDARLAEAPYLGGDDVCFADMVVGTPLYRYFTLDFDRGETPNLRAYYDRLTGRPAYATHVMVSYDSLRAK